MIRGLYFFLMLVIAIGCKNSKEPESDNKNISSKNFVQSFKKPDLPIKYADTALSAKKDSAIVDYEVLIEFVPDSCLKNIFHDSVKNISIHPVARIENKKNKYLIIKFAREKKIDLVVFVLDQNSKFISRLNLINNYSIDKYVHTVSVTEEPTFIIGRETKTTDGDINYTRSGFAYDENTKSFINVMNDSNEDLEKSEAVNPIDTLPQLNKLSGDYRKDKKNFVSIRDGKNENTYLFFIHFEKNNNKCTGELKGIMRLTSVTKGIYQESGDPCTLNFIFTKNSVTLIESNCGNHRGIDCLFDDTYKKPAKPKKAKSS